MIFRLYLLLALASLLPAADALKDAAAKRGIRIGAAVQPGYLAGELAFATTLSREFSMVEPEYEMLWNTVRPTQATYDFTGADAIVAYAARNNMPIRADQAPPIRQRPGDIVFLYGTGAGALTPWATDGALVGATLPSPTSARLSTPSYTPSAPPTITSPCVSSEPRAPPSQMARCLKIC